MLVAYIENFKHPSQTLSYISFGYYNNNKNTNYDPRV
jgi:hypothetical protein